MKKYLSIILVIFFIINLGGCKMLKKQKIILPSEELKIEKKYIKRIVESLNNKDDNFLDLLSYNATVESINLEKGIKYVYDIVDSKIITIKFDYRDTKAEYNNGGKNNRIMCKYDFYTNKKKFFIYIDFYIENENENFVGINYIQVDHAEKLENENYKIHNIGKAGIYYPGWEKDQDLFKNVLDKGVQFILRQENYYSFEKLKSEIE